MNLIRAIRQYPSGEPSSWKSAAGFILFAAVEITLAACLWIAVRGPHL